MNYEVNQTFVIIAFNNFRIKIELSKQEMKSTKSEALSNWNKRHIKINLENIKFYLIS